MKFQGQSLIRLDWEGDAATMIFQPGNLPVMMVREAIPDHEALVVSKRSHLESRTQEGLVFVYELCQDPLGRVFIF